VLFVPVRLQVNATDMRLFCKEDCMDAKRFDMDYPNGRLGSFCEDHWIGCVDLTGPLRTFARKNGKPLCFPWGDMHLNAPGYRVSAQAVAEWITRNLSLERGTIGRHVGIEPAR
jgi:hypothetical protein